LELLWRFSAAPPYRGVEAETRPCPVEPDRARVIREGLVLTAGMVALGLAAFLAMLGFIVLCDRV